ncbi:MAG: Alpha/beta hydrolase family protein [Myxococcaceae bacterium]|nr:Alpha/beta hydrolase family protein [Myxococcaceae bacterium]
MTYDPFSRGPYPVGVRSAALHDASRGGRQVELELWYPAAQVHTGQDISPQTQDRYSVFGSVRVTQEAVRDAAADQLARKQDFPLIVFSHGMAGHRRQSTFFCTQLASHGYVVVAPDHGGNTIADLIGLAMRVRSQELPSDLEELVAGYVFDRPRDVELILDAAEAGALALPLPIDGARVAVAGHSFGGFTALVCAARDSRVVSALALAPAGGAGPLSTAALSKELTLDFASRHVACLYLALERDTLLPLAGVEQLYRRTPPPARMFTLPNSDHMHFCDRAEASHEFFRQMPRFGIFGDLMSQIPPFSGLAPAEHGYAFANALGVAHADASLKGSRDGTEFLEHAVAQFERRGIPIRQTSPQKSSL